MARGSLSLFKQLHSMSMEEEKDNYMHKQQALINALTDEVQELYRS